MLSVRGIATAVWATLDARGLGDVVDFHGFGHAPAPVQIRLDDIDTAVFHELAERDARMVVFPGCDGDPGHGFSQLDMALQVFWKQGFFHPAQFVGPEPLCQANGKFHVVGHHRIDHQLGVFANCVAGQADFVRHDVDARDALFIMHGVGDLKRLKTEFHRPIEVVARAIAPDFLAGWAAEQAVHRLSEQFALQIPQGEINRALRARGQAQGPVPFGRAPHHVVEVFGGKTIAAF